MIERTLLAGVELDPLEILAAVTIRHGRSSIDDGLVASTATLRIVGVTPERVAAFAAGDPLDLLLADNVPRFRGRVSDAKLAEEGLEVVAVSSLAWYGNRPIGLGAWPSESWLDRLFRILEEAGLSAGLEWREILGTWAAQPSEWNVGYGMDQRVLVQGDFSTVLSARAAGETTLANYLGGSFRVSVPAAIATLPDGRILVQRLSIRPATFSIPLDLDPDLVAFAPEFTQTDDVVNEVSVEWESGTETAEDAASVARFGPRPESLRTELHVAADAEDLAATRIAARSFPRWRAEPVELLELEDAITIGTLVQIDELPEWAPEQGLSWVAAGRYAGNVEGWEDRLEADGRGGLEWNQQLHLSDPLLSGYDA